MSGAGADRNPPFNDPKHPDWYTDPQAGRQGQPAPGAGPYSYQPGPGMQRAPQHDPYGGPGYSQPKGLSIGALVCGIVGVVTFGFLFLPQIAAIVLGHIALGREPAGRGMALGGLIMGYVVVGLWTLLLMIGVLGAMSGS
ncbi:DUF4190 domain-containing protein [Arthrobacter mangrovi]|uniref:DUF4190 domain-containing protein n=1 Tax=Arthrobacter mangrovi TaxID=2966350 RepID=A0ABQ5MSJ8_9MICC|nr:DUF4190 domain-containing protein [Arthrobacter mangrovi]GLB66730.1 hypothetical protein AHIS1636_11690 [Arthrobacter mangrovi]